MSQPASYGRRRDKPVLSCSFCRARKLRCDRQSPCSSCLRRGKPEECTYSSSEQERKDAVDYRPHARSQRARERVARLERLVTQMRDQTSSLQASGILASSPEPFHDSESRLAPQNGHLADTVGKLTLTDDHAVYIGSTHWVTILEEIQILKDELSDNHSEAVRSRESTTFDADSTTVEPPATRISLLSSHPSLPKEQILAMIPPRKVVDRYVSHFFNAFDFASCILHRVEFLAEYSHFWENPSAAPIMWVGLLFSIMAISAFVQQQDVGPPLGLHTTGIQETLETYRTLTIHCLVAGNYLRPNRYTIETLALHFAVDQNMNLNTDIGNWILIGVIIRLALRMGLHRDPSHWPNIRPLEAEFRRRLWITLYHMDFFTSTQIGLPRIIKDSQCDTCLPANLFDDDLSFDNRRQPERPLTDSTPLSHIIQRQTIIKVAAEIYDMTETGPPSSATIAMLDAKLQKAIDSIPEQSKYQSLETSIVENPATILHRMVMDILINKAIYLLHRQSFMKGPKEEIMRSSKLCINAALMILEHQQRTSEETQPGGILFSVRWRVLSSFNHEFLQATMMLCFALNRFHQGHISPPDALHRQDEILAALTTAKSLWEKDADQSVEAHRAAKAITSVLKQDFDKSTSPTWIPLDWGTENTQMREQSATINHWTGFSGAAQNYLGDFDPGQNMIVDPSFSAIDFGSLWDDFVAEPIEGNWAGMH